MRICKTTTIVRDEPDQEEMQANDQGGDNGLQVDRAADDEMELDHVDDEMELDHENDKDEASQDDDSEDDDPQGEDSQYDDPADDDTTGVAEAVGGCVGGRLLLVLLVLVKIAGVPVVALSLLLVVRTMGTIAQGMVFIGLHLLLPSFCADF